MTGTAILALITIAAVIAPWLINASSADSVQVLIERLQPPSSAHWFGTDELGRDIFGRVVVASHLTLSIVALVSLLVLPFGLFVGMMAAYIGAWADICLMRLTDIVLAFPRLVRALALAAALGPGLRSVVLAIALTSWPV